MEFVFVSLHALLLVRHGHHMAARMRTQTPILMAFVAQVKSYSG
jgi:hypothetical protein